jgi:uncharacterized protein (UPF0332 family)
MTCDPLAFFEASKKIQKIASEEADFRAVANRVYYAAYHRCRLYYAALPQLSELHGNGVHEQLINALKIPSKKLSENGKARSEALAKYLRDVCNARVHADYHPDICFKQDKMHDVVRTGEVIFEVSSVTKGALNISSSPLGLLGKN